MGERTSSDRNSSSHRSNILTQALELCSSHSHLSQEAAPGFSDGEGAEAALTNIWRMVPAAVLEDQSSCFCLWTRAKQKCSFFLVPIASHWTVISEIQDKQQWLHKKAFRLNWHLPAGTCSSWAAAETHTESPRACTALSLSVYDSTPLKVSSEANPTQLLLIPVQAQLQQKCSKLEAATLFIPTPRHHKLFLPPVMAGKWLLKFVNLSCD